MVVPFISLRSLCSKNRITDFLYFIPKCRTIHSHIDKPVTKSLTIIHSKFKSFILDFTGIRINGSKTCRRTHITIQQQIIRITYKIIQCYIQGIVHKSHINTPIGLFIRFPMKIRINFLGSSHLFCVIYPIPPIIIHLTC